MIPRADDAIPMPPPSNRGYTLAELIIERRTKSNPTTRWVLDNIIARRVFRGEAGRKVA